jgi:MFS transporter, ACS family, glucarate transporter
MAAPPLVLINDKPSKSVGHFRWVVVGCTFVIAAVSYLDRNNISIAASFLQRDFHLSDAQLGIVFSAFILGYALSQPFAGRIADRYGASRSIAAAIIWWSVFTALLPLIPASIPGALAVLLAVRFLLGVGEAMIFPASNRLVASWIPSSERGLANGLIFTGVGVGGGVAPPLITAIMLHHSWRWAFWVCALIGLLAGLVWVRLVRNTPAEQKNISAAEKAYIEAGTPQPASGSHPARWPEVLMSGNVALLSISYFCYGYVAYIFFTWFFKYLSDVRGLNLRSSALYATLPFVAMALASTLGGLVSDRLLHRIGKLVSRKCIRMDRDAGSRPAARRIGTGRRRRRAILFAERILGDQCRYRRPISGAGIGNHEYGRSARGRQHRGVDARHCPRVRLDSVLRRRRYCLPGRGYGVAVC